MVTDNGDELINLSQAAERYRLDVKSLRRRIRSGQLESFVVPIDTRSQWVRVSDLEDLMRPRPRVVPSEGTVEALAS
jgi:hypothetical protein